LTDQISIEGQPQQPGEFRFAHLLSISPDYFRMLNVPLRNGREFADQDGANAMPVAIVSENLAQRYWPGQNPLGKRLKRGLEDSKFSWATVVGVVGDVKYDPFKKEDFAAAYFPYRQAPHQYSYIALRTEGDPTSFVAAVRNQIAAVDPNQPIFDIFTLQRVIHDQILGLSYVAVMLGVMGVIAVILASVGVYGVMAYSVAERIHEIGVRMALGAQPRDVLRMVLRRGVVLTAIGLGIGLSISLVFARFLAGLLFGVSASDSFTFVGITVLLTVVALLSCYFPARRATQVDPLVALRYE
jgi:putative ABC transport system permease protein